MNEFLKILLSLSLSGTLIILALYLCKPLYRGKLYRSWQYYIWLAVIVRLLLPFTPEVSPVGSLFQSMSHVVVQTADGQHQEPLSSAFNVKEFPTDADAAKQLASSAGQAFTHSGDQDDALSGGRVDRLTDGTAGLEQTQSGQQSHDAAAWDIWRICGMIWLLAATALLMRKVTIYQSFVKYIKAGCREVSDIRLWERLGKLVDQSDVKRAVGLYTNSLISSPLLIGFFHPCIILPTAALSDSDFENTIRHELTHYKRKDLFYKWLVQVTVCIHWFNPFVYLMSREINRACEFSCDEAVISTLNKKQQYAYGCTLLNAMKTKGTYRDAQASVTLSESGELLQERLKAIGEYRRKSKMKTAITLGVTIMLTLGTITAGAYSKPAVSADKDATRPFVSESLLTGVENTKESYYQNFSAQENDGNYVLSGTLHQNNNPRSLIRVVLSPDAKLTVSGSITPVKGDVKLIYQNQDGLLVTLAEGKAGDGKPISVTYEMQSAGKGEFYIEAATSAVCDFNLQFSTGDGIFYFLTNENPIGITY